MKVLISDLADKANIKFGTSGLRGLVTDQTDGLRVKFDTGDIVHLRPSGNAPELKCYVESTDEAECKLLVNSCMSRLKNICSKKF